MKNKGFVLYVIAVIAVIALMVSPLPAEETETDSTSAYKFSVLDNGLAVVIQKRDNIPLVNLVFGINMGSKDEDANTSGMIHILEHLLLLGDTELHNSDELNREMRRRGAQFNAHTSHDIMTFEISLPAESWEFGLDLLKEKVFQYKFTPDQLAREKEIIFEEISQHRDDPYTLGTQLAMQMLFEKHPYQHPIYGNEEVIKKATVEEISAFYRRFVVPENCSLAVVGEIDPGKVDEKVRSVFGPMEKKEKVKSAFPQARPLKKNVNTTRYLDIKEAKLIFGFNAPSVDDPDQLSMEILKLILGRGINPLLGGALFKMGKPLTYNIQARYIGLQYGGALLIYITLDPKKIKTVQRELIDFLKILWKFNYSTQDYPLEEQGYYSDYLEAAKSQVKVSHQLFQELGLNAALSYAKYALFYKDYQNKDEADQIPYMERVEKTGSAALRDVAARYLSGKKYVLVTILPEKKKDEKIRE